jgi:hypothetical protein
LLVQIEVYLLGVQLAQEAQQIDQAAPEPVHRPGRHHVDLAPCDGAQQRLHRRPALARKVAADAMVVEHRRYGPARPVGRSARLGGLIVGGGTAGVDGDALGHRKTCRTPWRPKKSLLGHRRFQNYTP